ncbi:hypothetical protein [Gordonia alkanivorans]
MIEAHDEWQVARRYLADINMAELRKVIAVKHQAARQVDAPRQIA